VVKYSKVKQVNQTKHPKPQAAMNHKRILSVNKSLQHLQIKYKGEQLRYTDIQGNYKIDQLDTKVQQCNQIYRI
jgi:hypothetical protein